MESLYHILVLIDEIPTPRHGPSPSSSNKFPSIIASPQQGLQLATSSRLHYTLCFQSESEGNTTLSVSAPYPYFRLSNAKLARSAAVTAVPHVTPVTKKALNGRGICPNAGHRLLASHTAPTPTPSPSSEACAPLTSTKRLKRC
jgi:hypothetical protein